MDPTGSITAEFWEEWVDCAHLEKMYIFTNLSVKDLILGSRQLHHIMPVVLVGKEPSQLENWPGAIHVSSK